MSELADQLNKIVQYILGMGATVMLPTLPLHTCPLF
ncbi:PTS system galactitol-specific IIC component [Lactobacillus rhamnosus GG] [Lacticaseibacillus rhamnosus]|nr:PTS system galactitol-specific IIC component [Lactobacillus rhamnosus GG] [Lacticaseibacillus rhamnosus]